MLYRSVKLLVCVSAALLFLSFSPALPPVLLLLYPSCHQQKGSRGFINQEELKLKQQSKFTCRYSWLWMYSSTSWCRDLCGSIIKQPASTSQSLRAGGIHGGYVIPNQSGAITHMVVEKDEKQLLTAGYLLGLDSLETTHSYVNVKTKKGQMGQSDSSSARAKEVSRGLKHTKQRNVISV